MTHTNETKPTASHFPEPWTYDFSPYGIVDIFATDVTGEYPKGLYVAEIDCDDVGRFTSHEQHEANARRICAAVNACKGISTEALERGIVAELRAALQETRAEIEHWHSDMLTPEERQHPRGNGWACVYDRLSALLAKMTGAAA
ncbi:MAG TPA: hypothetical protein VMF69_10105 [Gemmataceae bacterium]|nr:hypothetical protein [Gemmataceae bacterium]